MEYSYSHDEKLQQEWRWTERFATQPEILNYLNHVVDRFDLRSSITFNTRIESAFFDERSHVWNLKTHSGEILTAQFCIFATGCLSSAIKPNIPDINLFSGKIYYTAAWSHEPVDFTGLRVGIIGTGSSGIQVIPEVANQALHLTVFQRTPHFSVPAGNGPLSKEEELLWKHECKERSRQAREMTFSGIFGELSSKTAVFDVDHEARQIEYERRWSQGGLNFLFSFNDLLFNKKGNDTASDFVRNKIREIVKNPKVADTLLPTNYYIGAKRLCCGTNYYETYNKKNVTLVDIRETPIKCFIPSGLCDKREQIYELDAVIFATGFDAMTGAISSIDIRGRDKLLLKNEWKNGPCTYLGLMTHGFPNLFMVTGPGSPSVLSNMMVSIEQHVEWITECLNYLREHRYKSIEPELESQIRWGEHVQEVAKQTIFPYGNSWYKGANIEGKPSLFMPYVGGVNNYRKICRDVADAGYEGFRIREIDEVYTPASVQ